MHVSQQEKGRGDNHAAPPELWSISRQDQKKKNENKSNINKNNDNNN